MLKSSRGQAQSWSNDYFIPTEDERLRGLTIWLPLIPFCVITACLNELATGPLGEDILTSQFKLHFKKFGTVISAYYLYQTLQTFYFFRVNFCASPKLI